MISNVKILWRFLEILIYIISICPVVRQMTAYYYDTKTLQSQNQNTIKIPSQFSDTNYTFFSLGEYTDCFSQAFTRYSKEISKRSKTLIVSVSLNFVHVGMLICRYNKNKNSFLSVKIWGYFQFFMLRQQQKNILQCD